MSAEKGGCGAAVKTGKPTTHSSSSSLQGGGGGEAASAMLRRAFFQNSNHREAERTGKIKISPQRSQVRETNDWIVLIQRTAFDWVFLSNQHSGKTQEIQKA